MNPDLILYGHAVKRFRVAFSFAGKERDYVEKVADILAERLGKSAVLYDKYHEAEFARRDLGLYLPELYHKQTDLIVVVVCPNYAGNEWCGLEWTAIHALLKNRKDSELMLTRFKRATLQGLYDTAGWIDLDSKSPEQAAVLILERLSLNERHGKVTHHNKSSTKLQSTSGNPRILVRKRWLTLVIAIPLCFQTAVYFWGKSVSKSSGASSSESLLQLVFEEAPVLIKAEGVQPQLSFEVGVRRDGAKDFVRVRNGDAVASGMDHYVLLAKPQRGGFLYIFQIDSSGRVDWLFPKNPRSPHSFGANPLPPGATVQLPPSDAGQAYFLDAVTGMERIYAVLSTRRWSELETTLENCTRDSKGANASAAFAPANERLEFRGVGGTTQDALTSDLASQGGANEVTLPADRYEGTEGIVVIKRWFHHVSP